MIGFSEFNQRKRETRKFVSLWLDDYSQKKMMNWASGLGFNTRIDYDGNPTDSFDFHLTVFYTSNTSSITNDSIQLPQTRIIPENFDLLGKALDIPVLKIEKTAPLLFIRNHFESLGLEDEWPEWKPHVSLSYKYDGSPTIKGLPLPDFPIYVDCLKIESTD